MDISEYIFSNAVLKMRKGDHDGALADFAETIRANPKHVDAWSLHDARRRRSAQWISSQVNHVLSSTVR